MGAQDWNGVRIVKEYRRFLKRNPLVTLLAACVLALGFTGAAVTSSIMLALSAPRSSGLRSWTFATIAEGAGGGSSRPLSWQAYTVLHETSDSSEFALAAYTEAIPARLNHDQGRRQIVVAAVSPSFFGVFTHGLEAGQDFSSSWQSGHGGNEVIISRDLAQSLFDSPSEAVGHSILINDDTLRIVGVAPRSFSGLWTATDAWVTPDKIVFLAFGPSRFTPQGTGRTNSPTDDNAQIWRTPGFFYILAGSSHLSPVSLQQILWKLVRLPDNLPGNFHISDGLTNDPVRDAQIRSWARFALLLSVTLILVAGLNYCCLLLAEAPRSLEEVRLKRVLGASIPRILGENMAGPVLTVLTGFFWATCSTIVATKVLGTQGHMFLPGGRLPWKTTLAALGTGGIIACGLAIIISLIPALRLLKEGGTPHTGYTSTTGKTARLAMYGMVSSQIASCILACLLTALMMDAVHSLAKEDLGFDSNRLTVSEIGAASKGSGLEVLTTDTGDFPLATFTRLVVTTQYGSVGDARARHTSASSCAPLGQPMKVLSVQRMDRELAPRSIHFCAVSREFFQTVGNPMLEGRGFSSDSFTGSISEVVVNRRLASELWPNEDPLHRTVRVKETASGLEFVAEVVGVSQDMKISGWASTPDATLFIPLRGNAFALSFPFYFLTKGDETPRQIESLIGKQAAVTTPFLGVTTAYRADEHLQASFMQYKVRVYLSVCGAVLVAIIALLGLYGVLVHSVNSRRKELAIRGCFGASRQNLSRLIVGQALRCSAVAVAISLLAWQPLIKLESTAWAGRMFMSWRVAFVVVLMCLMATIVISLLPAAAAARISPVEALKEQ
jgi:ABC-type antimicrobial peptide transport system permease subunit